MKTIILLTVAFIIHTISTFSQTDSILHLKETDFSIHNLRNVKYESTGETITEKVLIDLDDVQSLTFLSNDSLILAKNHKFAVRTKLSQIDEVTKYKFRFSPVLGVAIGALGGILLSGITVWLIGAGYDLSSPAPLIIAPIGGLIGAAITSSINHTIYDLSSVPDKDKKAKLIKFLRQK